ncbi:MAG: PLP-dependent aminotransferase family protein [Paracoccaceae bacterium]
MVISVETFFLDQSYEGTLQQQIQRTVIEAVLSTHYQPGERMPSSRKLAEHLGISRITVTLAYAELVSNDYLSARGRSGYFISETAPGLPAFDLPESPKADDVDWQRSIGQYFANYSGLTRPPNWRDYRYPFIYGQADIKLFDHQNWRLCAMQALGQKDFISLTSDYYDRDDPKLIEFITRHILPRRGISARPEQVLLTLGAQNALWLSAQILLTQRRTAAMENPGYAGLREILGQTRCNTLSIDVDQQGLPPAQIPADTDVVFTTPSHHAPTNATMPLARRNELLVRASTDDFIIVENDYEFEMSFLHAPSPALKSLDTKGRVVYIGSFSKSLFPGLRLGYLVGSEPFIRQARALRALVLRHPPGHIQRTLTYFLSLGHYDAQVAKTGRAYKRRRAVMDAAIAQYGLTTAGPASAGGSSIWMKAPDGVNTAQLADTLRSQQVIIEPGRVFFSQDDDNNQFYRLAYSSIPADRIPEGISRIARILS